eukprot:gene3140-3417_t
MRQYNVGGRIHSSKSVAAGDSGIMECAVACNALGSACNGFGLTGRKCFLMKSFNTNSSAPDATMDALCMKNPADWLSLGTRNGYDLKGDPAGTGDVDNPVKAAVTELTGVTPTTCATACKGTAGCQYFLINKPATPGGTATCYLKMHALGGLYGTTGPKADVGLTCFNGQDGWMTFAGQLDYTVPSPEVNTGVATPSVASIASALGGIGNDTSSKTYRCIKQYTIDGTTLDKVQVSLGDEGLTQCAQKCDDQQGRCIAFTMSETGLCNLFSSVSFNASDADPRMYGLCFASSLDWNKFGNPDSSSMYCIKHYDFAGDGVRMVDYITITSGQAAVSAAPPKPVGPAAALCETILRFDRREWTLTNANGSIALQTSIPAYPLEVLRANGVIGDPLYRYGEQESRWVAYETWTFNTSFTAEEAAQLSSQEKVILYLGGLDTFADVAINGQKLLEANNFHRTWSIPVKKFLNPSDVNTIEIKIKSAYEESVALQAKHPYYIPNLYNTGSIGAYNFARKPAFDFGWDWGPAFAAAGIQGTVKLIAFNEPTLSGAFVAQTPTDTGFTLKVTSQFWIPPGGGKGVLTLAVPELKAQKKQLVTDKIQLWWPAGGNYGPQKLYKVDISFVPESVAASCAAASASKKAVNAGTKKPAVKKPAGAARQVLGRMDDIEASTAEEEASLVERASAAPADKDSANKAYIPRKTVPAAKVKPNSNAKKEPLGAATEPAGKAKDTKKDALKAATEPTDKSKSAQKDALGAATEPSEKIKDKVHKQVKKSPADAADGSICAAAASSVSKRVGFRTIELVRDPLPKAIQDLFGNNTGFEYAQQKQYVHSILARDNAGQWALDEAGKWTHFPGNDTDVPGSVAESFYLRVNGVPIYMKGANLIPMTVLPANTTTAIINMTLQAAVDANQNMLRVWGGGLYHPDAFYEFCDEHGLLVWQDAMFGGSHYPRNPEFLANIAAEVTQQAQRLSWHPSVALWCGNNELELSYEWPNNTLIRSNRNTFAQDYMVNINLVRKMVKKEQVYDCAGVFQGHAVGRLSRLTYVAKPAAIALNGFGHVQCPSHTVRRYGSIHHYDYLSDCEDFRSYPAPKFVSEFGWQSYPMLETYAAAMDPETDWGVGNPMNEFRNRRTDVTPQFLSQYARHFKLPAEWNPEDVSERMSRFKSYLWIGHIQHARCYETALNLWRRLRSHAKSLTMGVMYWQLNDIWAGASWSSVDISGRWKPVHYAVKRAFAPLAVQAIKDIDTVDIFVVSDFVNTTNVNITLQLISLDDTSSSCATVNQTVSSQVFNVPGSFATRVLSMSVETLLSLRPGCMPTTCFLSVSAKADGVLDSESQLWLTPFRDMELPNPHVRITELKQTSDTTVAITLESERPALLVLVSELQPLRGHFDDNVFATNPCAPKTITFHSIDGPINPELVTLESFKVESLYNHSSWIDTPAPNATDAAVPSGPDVPGVVDPAPAPEPSTPAPAASAEANEAPATAAEPQQEAPATQLPQEPVETPTQSTADAGRMLLQQESSQDTAPFFGFIGAAAALVFSCMGAAYGTAKSGVGIASMGVMRPELVMKSIVPVIMAGVLGIYGLIIAVIISTGVSPGKYTLFDGFAHLASGLSCGLAGLAAGMAIGIVGDAGVRANAQQPKLFVGMILILIFAEALALYGLIVLRFARECRQLLINVLKE